MYQVNNIIKTIEFNNINLEMLLKSFLNQENILLNINKKIDQITGILYLLKPTIFPDLIFYSNSIKNREILNNTDKLILIHFIISYYDYLTYDEIMNIWKELI